MNKDMGGRQLVLRQAILSDRKSTVAEVTFFIGDVAVTGTGSSKRVSEDAYDAQIGNQIAYTRAIERALTELKKDLKKKLAAQGVTDAAN
jgi:hypothetical protein